MTSWVIPPVGLIEPVPAPEFYIDGIGAIELFGACVRMHLYSQQMPLECAGGPSQKVVMVKVVRPIVALPCAIGQVAQCLMLHDLPILARGPPEGGGFRPRVVG